MKTNEKLQHATELFEKINSGELDNRIKSHRKEVSDFLYTYSELLTIDAYKYSVLLGFIHSV